MCQAAVALHAHLCHQAAASVDSSHKHTAAAVASRLYFECSAYHLPLIEADRQLHADLCCRCFSAVWPGRRPWSPVLLSLRGYAFNAEALSTGEPCVPDVELFFC
jgi:hypothetical protein